MERQLSSSVLDERRAALTALTTLPMEEASRVVLGALRSSDDGVRIDAARAASLLRLAPAAAIAGRWLVEPSARVRCAALGVLEHVPAPELTSAIARMLSDGASEVRAAACSALGFQVKGEAPPALIARLDDPVFEVRLAAIQALGNLRSPHAVVPLTGVIQGDDARLREAGVRALGSIGSADATPSLVLSLSDAEPGVRAAAATALGATGAKGVDAALVAVLAREQVPTVRVAVVDELARRGTPDSSRVIVDRLRSDASTRWERERIMRALRAAGASAVRALELCVTDAESSESALRCAEVLVAIQDQHTWEILVSALGAGQLPSAAGIALLGNAGDVSALPFVLEHLDTPDDAVRRAALGAVVELVHPAKPDGRVVAPLRGTLRRAQSLDERMLAVAALGRTANPGVFEDLAPLVAAEVPTPLRIAAIRALGDIRSPARDQLLVGCLSDRVEEVRWAAASSLRQGFGPVAASRLVASYRSNAIVERDLVALAMGGARAAVLTEQGRRGIHELMGEARGARRDSLLEASLAAPSARSSALARALAFSAHAADRAKVAELCEWLPASRATLLVLLRDSSLRVRANAAWALGAVGRPEDVSVLFRVIADEGGVVAGNAAASVGRIAARHELRVEGELCRLMSSPSPLARVNALTALERSLGRCDAEVEYTVLRLDPSHYVRRAAALMMSAPGVGVNRSRRDALLECARNETHGSVAAACVDGQRSPPTQGVEELLVYVVEAERDAPTVEAPFAVQMSLGFIRVGIADRRGAVLLRVPASGGVRLLPTDTVIWPAPVVHASTTARAG